MVGQGLGARRFPAGSASKRPDTQRRRVALVSWQNGAMTVTDLPTSVHPVGLARLRALTGAASDEQAVDEAIRRLEATGTKPVDSGAGGDAEASRQWLAKIAANPPIKSSIDPDAVFAAIDAGREQQLSKLVP